MAVIVSAIELAYIAVMNFSAQIFFCEFMFCMRLRRRPMFLARVLAIVPVVLGPILYQWSTGNVFYMLPIFFWGWFSYIFTLLVIISSLLLWFCFDESYFRLLFYAAAAHIIQNMIHQVRTIVQILLFPEGDGAAFHLTMILLSAGMFALAYFVLVRRLTSHRVDVDNRSLLAFTILTTLIVSILNYWTYSFSYLSLATYVYQLVCCVLLLALQFGIFDRSLIAQEHAVMEQILQEKEQQYRLSQENIDIINRKCHDIKHQIALLRGSQTPAEQEQGLREMEEAVMIYDTTVKTGNQILDTLLTEKSLQCERHRIDISCMVDGQLLCFMDSTDLYSLFGNALDNAIECVQKEDEENRIITLCVACQAGCVLVSLDNYCSVPVQFQNGLPLTTKQDNGYHGFGTRSIQYVSQKYDGTMAMKHIAEENRFSLTILFPGRC